MGRRKFDKEFKETIVELYNSGKKVSELNIEYNIDTGTINRWIREFNSETGSFKDENRVSLEKEIKELKKRNKILQEERDILKKAMSIFSVRD